MLSVFAVREVWISDVSLWEKSDEVFIKGEDSAQGATIVKSRAERLGRNPLGTLMNRCTGVKSKKCGDMESRKSISRIILARSMFPGHVEPSNQIDPTRLTTRDHNLSREISERVVISDDSEK